MNRTERELWKSLDDAVFGTRDPEIIKDKLKAMKAQLDRERSSLGRFLESLRREEDFTTEYMAKKVGVELAVWKDWEMDFATPTEPELESVIQKMRWTRPRKEVLWKLWNEAARFRIKRMILGRGQLMAARQGSSDGGLVWESIGKENQETVTAWGKANGYQFPDDLTTFFETLETDEARERWLDELLESE